MTSTIAPLETQGNPRRRARGGNVDPDTALAAVAGVRGEVGDVMVPGALRRTLRERFPWAGGIGPRAVGPRAGGQVCP